MASTTPYLGPSVKNFQSIFENLPYTEEAVYIIIDKKLFSNVDDIFIRSESSTAGGERDINKDDQSSSSSDSDRNFKRVKYYRTPKPSCDFWSYFSFQVFGV